MKAILMLEDGSFFEGVSIGLPGERVGEVILNTAVVGYQEMMTDPSNAGKILVFTYPLIGNYGIAKKFYESKKCWVEAVVMKEDSRVYSNWQAQMSYQDFVKEEKVLAISGVDTRTIAVTIRDEGQMLGIISTKDFNKTSLLGKLKEYKKSPKRSFIKDISVKKAAKVNKNSAGAKVAVLDLGISNSFLRQLKTLGCEITLLPYDTKAEEMLKLDLDGLIISNGPEEDAAIPQVAKQIKGLLGKIPVLGITLGHEIIALALGGGIKKLKVGHRGVNYPVKPPDSYKGEITVQNHSFVVDEASIKGKADIEITLRNINDNSIEEMQSDSLRFISTQYYPASPGFDEVNEVFKRFLKLMHKTNKKERNLACQNAKI